jgi:hypothetical protein
MILMSRVEGPDGLVTRELSTVLDHNFAYSVIFSKDAFDLGYPEAAFRPKEFEKTHPDRVLWVNEFRGTARSVLARLAKVSIGRLVARDVDALLVDTQIQYSVHESGRLILARMIPVDLILGRTFLKNFKMTTDIKAGYLSLSESRKAGW